MRELELKLHYHFNDVSWLNTVMKRCIKEMSDIEALRSSIDAAESFDPLIILILWEMSVYT